MICFTFLKPLPKDPGSNQLCLRASPSGGCQFSGEISRIVQYCVLGPEGRPAGPGAPEPTSQLCYRATEYLGLLNKRMDMGGPPSWGCRSCRYPSTSFALVLLVSALACDLAKALLGSCMALSGVPLPLLQRVVPHHYTRLDSPGLNSDAFVSL